MTGKPTPKKKTVKAYSVPFALKGIVTNQFFIRQDPSEKGTRAKLGYRVGFAGNPESRTVAAIFRVRLVRGDEDLVTVEMICHFELTLAFWESLEEKDGKRQLPLPTALHMATIAAGTARGVFHAKTENTPYARYFLNTVNLTKLITGAVPV